MSAVTPSPARTLTKYKQSIGYLSDSEHRCISISASVRKDMTISWILRVHCQNYTIPLSPKCSAISRRHGEGSRSLKDLRKCLVLQSVQQHFKPKQSHRLLPLQSPPRRFPSFYVQADDATKTTTVLFN